MQMAAEQNPKFKFEASEWPNGHYVHTLAGHKEEPMGYHYWLLYRLPETPDPTSPPGNQLVAPVGKLRIFTQIQILREFPILHKLKYRARWCYLFYKNSNIQPADE